MLICMFFFEPTLHGCIKYEFEAEKNFLSRCISLPEHYRIENQLGLECAGKLILTNPVVLLSLFQYRPVHMRMRFVRYHLHLCRLTTRNTRVLLDRQRQMQGKNSQATTNEPFLHSPLPPSPGASAIIFFGARFAEKPTDPSEIARKKHYYHAFLARASHVTLVFVSF